MINEKILAHIENKEMIALKNLLANAEELEILQAFNELSPEEQVITFRLLAKNDALSLFEQLDTDLQRNLLSSFSNEKTIEFVNEMAPDDRVKLLDELPASVAKKLISSLSPEERKVTNILMGYESETAGRVMTTEYISLARGMTVRQAMEKVRNQAADKETVYTLYVTNNSRKLEGVVSLKDLLVTDDDIVIEEIMTKNTISVSTDTTQEEVAHTLKELDLLAIPVVDKEERLVGIVTIDDAVDILEQEATDEMLDHAGLADITGKESNRSETLIHGSIWKIWRVRLPFLLITLVAGFLAGMVIEGFEETLESIAVVAIFIPLIMDMGGNVGTQSSTVFSRGIALGHIHPKKFFRHFLKETGIGLSMGILIGLMAGTIVTLWQGSLALGLAVGLALVCTMTLAALLGFLVPYLLVKCNADQAAGSAPIITSIKDIAGLIIYFLFVITFMSQAIYGG